MLARIGPQIVELEDARLLNPGMAVPTEERLARSPELLGEYDAAVGRWRHAGSSQPFEQAPSLKAGGNPGSRDLEQRRGKVQERDRLRYPPPTGREARGMPG